MNNKKRIVLVGATSAIAEHCARRWVQNQSIDLTLVGRNVDRLKRVATDLKVRSPRSSIDVVQTEFFNPVVIQETVDKIVNEGPVDIVFIAHGCLPEQINCQNDLEICCEALQINGISPVLFAETFAKHMAQTNHGIIALVGSVAGDRGRKSNYVYGSAKGLIDRYAQGLQHRFAGTGVRVVLIKPGPTDTPMTAHLKEQGAKLESVEGVAWQIVDAIEQKKTVAYVPGKWRFIMLVLKHMPAFVFNKLNI